MDRQYPFAQRTVRNATCQLELWRVTAQARSLSKPSEPPKSSHMLDKRLAMFALKSVGNVWPQPGPLVVWLAILALLAGCVPIHPVTDAHPVSSTVLYQTGFEPPAFTPGSVVLQQGWLQPVGQYGGATIATVAPASGVQALRNDGALMTPVPTRPWSGVLTLYPLNYNVIDHHTPVLTIEADVRLDGPRSGKDSGVYANLVALGFTPFGRAGLAFNRLASDAAVYSVSGASAPAALGKYQHLGLRLDFTHQTAEYFLNGIPFGIEPFRDTKTALGLFAVRLDLVGDPAIAAQYTAFYDNLVVKAVVP